MFTASKKQKSTENRADMSQEEESTFTSDSTQHDMDTGPEWNEESPVQKKSGKNSSHDHTVRKNNGTLRSREQRNGANILAAHLGSYT